MIINIVDKRIKKASVRSYELIEQLSESLFQQMDSYRELLKSVGKLEMQLEQILEILEMK